MLEVSELAGTCKKVVRMFKIRFAHNSVIVSCDLSVDWPTKNRQWGGGRRSDFMSIFCCLACHLASQIHSDGPSSEL